MPLRLSWDVWILCLCTVNSVPFVASRDTCGSFHVARCCFQSHGIPWAQLRWRRQCRVLTDAADKKYVHLFQRVVDVLDVFFLDLFFPIFKSMFLQNHIIQIFNSYQLIFLNMLRFHSGTFPPGFFHLLAANSTQILDLDLMSMTHQESYSRIMFKKKTHPEKQTMRASPTSTKCRIKQEIRILRHLLYGSCRDQRPALGRRRALRVPAPSATAWWSRRRHNKKALFCWSAWDPFCIYIYIYT